MATYENNDRVIKMKNSFKWTKVYIDEKKVIEGHPIVVNDTEGCQYHLEQCLGHGFEGEVWKVSLGALSPLEKSEKKEMFALKFEIGDVDIGQQLKGEYETLKSLDHPFILKPLKYWYAPMIGDREFKRGHMLSHYIPGQSLDKRDLNPTEARQIMRNLITVVKYLNVERELYHGDLKPDNVIITDTEDKETDTTTIQPILVDFGFPGAIKNNPYIDRKQLGLIYLKLIGLNEDQIHKFKTNLDWYAHFKKLYTSLEIKTALGDIKMTDGQVNILTAFFDGTSHEKLYELIEVGDTFSKAPTAI